jgi:hypothetical protein
MEDAVEADLYQRTWKLLQPGEIELDGLVVHTEFDGDTEPEMHQATVEIGELIAEHAGHDPKDTFVYSGTDDPDFSSNQHQGLTLADESFVWECQQLFRNGSFDLVFYFEATTDSEGLRDAVREAGYDGVIVHGGEENPSTTAEQ